MSVLAIIVPIALVCFVVWIILKIPGAKDSPMRDIIIGVACLLLIVWILQTLGVHTGLPRVRLW